MSDVRWRWVAVFVGYRAFAVGLLVAVVAGFDISLNYELTDAAKRWLAGITAVLILADTTRIAWAATRRSRT